MRVLFVNKFWFRSGGVETVLFDEVEWLQAAGHETAAFAVTDPRNEPSPWSDFFVPYRSLERPSALAVRDQVRTAAAMFENGVARRRFADLIAEFKPDVIHAHSVHRQLPPSIFVEARCRDIPVVQTLHDYHVVCPADRLIQGDGTLCAPQECRRVNYLPAMRHRCTRGSLVQSTLAAAELAYHRLLRSYKASVQRFIAPSRFLAERLREGGWDLPIDVIPNAVRSADRAAPLTERQVVLAGRLVPEKGIQTAVDAAARARFTLRVVGRGPLETIATRPHVELTGWLDPARMRTLYGSARAAVVPSEWYENAPLAVLEPMSLGVPVVASRIGGIPELLEDGVSGLLVEPGSVEALASAVHHVLTDREAALGIGGEALKRCRELYSPEVHVQALLRTYGRALQ